MLDMLSQPGVWKRAGVTALMSGVDIAEAMARLPSTLNRDFARCLLIAAERPWLAAALEKDKPDGD